MQVVWFKRDLRINDNLALSLASEKGDALPLYGQPLILMIGDAVEVFEQLIQKHPIKNVWSHQETWND